MRRGVLGVVLAVVAALAMADVGRGIARSRAPDALGDLVTRWQEYEVFRSGIYPNRRLDAPATWPRMHHSVYPPYAFTFFVPLFEPGGLRQGAFLVNLGSLCSLVALATFGWRRLRSGGVVLAGLGAVSAGAIPGVIGCLSVGQFSLICVALVVAQLRFLERGRGGAAGLCWALAMTKPQIALPFAVLFLPGGRWRGLAWGGLLLSAAAVAACWWTGVSPARLLHFYAFRQSLRWTGDDDVHGLPRLAPFLGLGPRATLACGAVAACGAGAAVWWRVGRFSRRVDLPTLAGACGLFGAAIFYHRIYDDVMLTPAIIAILARAAAAPGPASLAVAVILPLTAWLPYRLWTAVPAANSWRVATWMVAGCVLAVWSVRPAEARAADPSSDRA